ncbi:MAG: hypothetical protein ABIH41_06255 [Nanoarchaeota archaeon]
MELFTRKNGIRLCVVGAAILSLNLLTLKLWDVDIDILGAMILVLGFVFIIAGGRTIKHSSKLLTRRNGLWLCVIGEAIMIILGYAEFLRMTETGAIIGLGVFVLGLVLIAGRWKH